jgi:hypothetical protein
VVVFELSEYMNQCDNTTVGVRGTHLGSTSVDNSSIVPQYLGISWKMSLIVEQKGGFFNPGAPGWRYYESFDTANFRV